MVTTTDYSFNWCAPQRAIFGKHDCDPAKQTTSIGFCWDRKCIQSFGSVSYGTLSCELGTLRTCVSPKSYISWIRYADATCNAPNDYFSHTVNFEPGVCTVDSSTGGSVKLFCSYNSATNTTSVSSYLYSDQSCTNLVSVRTGQHNSCLGTRERFVCPADYNAAQAGTPPPIPTDTFHRMTTCVGGCDRSSCGTIYMIAGVCVPLRQADQPNSVSWLASCAPGTNTIRLGLYTGPYCNANTLATFQEQNVATCRSLNEPTTFVSNLCAATPNPNGAFVGEITSSNWTNVRILDSSSCTTGNVLTRSGLAYGFCNKVGDGYGRTTCENGRMVTVPYNKYDKQCTNGASGPSNSITVPLCLSNISISCGTSAPTPSVSSTITWNEYTRTDCASTRGSTTLVPGSCTYVASRGRYMKGYCTSGTTVFEGFFYADSSCTNMVGYLKGKANVCLGSSDTFVCPSASAYNATAAGTVPTAPTVLDGYASRVSCLSSSCTGDSCLTLSTKVGVCIPGSNGEGSDNVKATASVLTSTGWLYATYSDSACLAFSGAWNYFTTASACVRDASYKSNSPARFYLNTYPIANVGPFSVNIPNVIYPSQQFYLNSTVPSSASFGNNTCSNTPVIAYIRTPSWCESSGTNTYQTIGCSADKTSLVFNTYSDASCTALSSSRSMALPPCTDGASVMCVNATSSGGSSIIGGGSSSSSSSTGAAGTGGGGGGGSSGASHTYASLSIVAYILMTIMAIYTANSF